MDKNLLSFTTFFFASAFYSLRQLFSHIHLSEHCLFEQHCSSPNESGWSFHLVSPVQFIDLHWPPTHPADVVLRTEILHLWDRKQYLFYHIAAFSQTMVICADVYAVFVAIYSLVLWKSPPLVFTNLWWHSFVQKIKLIKFLNLNQFLLICFSLLCSLCNCNVNHVLMIFQTNY